MLVQIQNMIQILHQVSLDEETIEKSNKSIKNIADILDASSNQVSTKEENREWDNYTNQ